MDKEDEIRRRFTAVRDLLNERQRRLFAASEVRAFGYGGIVAVARATGIARSTLGRGLKDLGDPDALTGEVRRAGGGRPLLTAKSPELLNDLNSLLEPSTMGDPMRLLRWVSKSQAKIAAALRELGHTISTNSVGPLLERIGYRRQANRKTREGSSHPDRDAQFEHINAKAIAFASSGDPVISVDTKKKENLGDFKNAGSDYRPNGSPYLVRTHDFVDKELGKAVPYGVYDVGTNTAWVSVGINNDTAEFAVNSIRLWWVKMGRELYPETLHLMITADGGGSNGSRVKLWKRELQKFADEFGLSITVCHYPPGTSKWNKIEHRLFCYITQNWRGTPLTDRLAIVELIASTKTEKGLTVRCELDDRLYEKGLQVTEQEVESLYIKRDDFHPEWNYTIHPRVNGVKPDEAFIFG